MKIVVIFATYNEQRFIRACLEHYLQQGIGVYLLDNDSTDATVEIAREYLNKSLIGIETIPRKGMFELRKQLIRKEELADELQADWFMHADPDEIRLSPTSNQTLAEAIYEVDQAGYNAISFMEYTFLPMRESSDLDHSDFQKILRWYNPFGQRHPHRLNAWKKQPRRWSGVKAFTRELIKNHRWGSPSINLEASGGYLVSFPGIRPYPVDFKLKHYIILSLGRVIQKHIKKAFDPKEFLAMLDGVPLLLNMTFFYRKIPYASIYFRR